MSKRKKTVLSAVNIRGKIAEAFSCEQILLPSDEYAKVMSEFNTHMSEEERNRRYVTKPIGDYYYTIINKGFNEYIIVDKSPIIQNSVNIWENGNE